MEAYFEHSGVSQSQLKSLLIHPQAWTTEEESELYFEEKKHFIIGSAVDFCLTQPSEEFLEVYHISNVQNKPTDTIKSIINMVFDNAVEVFGPSLGNITDHDYSELVLDACNSHSYQSRWNDQTRINKVYENWEYWEDLKLAHGKIVLSQEESDLIDAIVMSLRTNEATSHYFNSENILYQLPIYFDYEGVECKALLDMVIINKEDKTIQPIDIKTMGDYTIKFPKSLRRRRYDIQAAFYTEALKWLYPEYEILPFKFIVESTIDVGTPLVFTCDETLLEIGKKGRPEVYLYGEIKKDGWQGRSTKAHDKLEEIKGFTQLIELYKYYTIKGFDKDQIVRESKSELNIDWSGIMYN